MKLLPFAPRPDWAKDQTVVVDGRQYWECGTSGWDLMLGWLSGPETLMRSPDNREHYWDVVEHLPGGGVTESRQPMPPEDRLEIEDSENEYLDVAGLPSDRPYGYRWFQVLPGDVVAEDINAAACQAIDAAGLTHSRYISKAVPHIRAALQRLYA